MKLSRLGIEQRARRLSYLRLLNKQYPDIEPRSLYLPASLGNVGDLDELAKVVVTYAKDCLEKDVRRSIGAGHAARAQRKIDVIDRSARQLRSSSSTKKGAADST